MGWVGVVASVELKRFRKSISCVLLDIDPILNVSQNNRRIARCFVRYALFPTLRFFEIGHSLKIICFQTFRDFLGFGVSKVENNWLWESCSYPLGREIMIMRTFRFLESRIEKLLIPNEAE